MPLVRKHFNTGYRAPGHDYRARCVYHLVLNKADDLTPFGKVIGVAGSCTDPPGVSLSPIGIVVATQLEALTKTFPHITILRRCIMPDHVHLALFVKEAGLNHLGEIVRTLKRCCLVAWNSNGANRRASFFADGYHDTILRSRSQLRRIMEYIDDNPCRYLVRKGMSGWFCHSEITDGSKLFHAFGNTQLLAEPVMEAVRMSRGHTSQ